MICCTHEVQWEVVRLRNPKVGNMFEGLTKPGVLDVPGWVFFPAVRIDDEIAVFFQHTSLGFLA